MTPAQRNALLTLVDETIDALKAVQIARTPAEREAAIRRVGGMRDRRLAAVDGIFGITPDDRNVIQSVPMP